MTLVDEIPRNATGKAKYPTAKRAWRSASDRRRSEA